MKVKLSRVKKAKRSNFMLGLKQRAGEISSAHIFRYKSHDRAESDTLSTAHSLTSVHTPRVGY